MAADTNTTPENFQFSSSIAGDAWRSHENKASHFCWYFDAVSDDGRDALVIFFFDNFIFSPSYNSVNQQNGSSERSRFPAFALFYYRDGKLLHSTVSEYAEGSFSADPEVPSCRIGNNSFQFEAAPYGEGYLLQVDSMMKNGRRLTANLEWLIVEGNLLPAAPDAERSHSWNLVAPRCDVTGKIEIYRRSGKSIKEILQFRGTGYHDHKNDSRWLPTVLQHSSWGRAHFADVTAVFYDYLEIGASGPVTKMLISSVNKLEDKEAYSEEKIFGRTIYGLKYPQRLTFYTRGNLRLRLKQTQVIDSSFHYIRFLSEAVLTVGDGKPRKTIAVTEFFNPKALRNRWLDWLTNRRIKRVP
jgi:hypothetical protein